MDQIGATIGPLIVTAVLFFRSSYHEAFGALLVSALASLSILIAGKFIYPRPRDFEVHGPELKTKGLSRRFWLYVVAVGFIGAGFADFPLIAFHFQKISSVPEIWIPAFYAVAMGIDAIAALVLGYLFDRKGMGVLIVIPFISALFAPLVFMGNFGLALLGMAFWGIGMGALESIVKAAVGELAPADRRASAYGIFFTGFGIFWFIGSAAMGLLYDYSIPWLVLFSVIMQLISVPFLIHVSRSGQK
jgi:MFS family permease